jgi:hypothetical protein
MKHYHYLDGYAAERLKKVAKLLQDPELQAKVERHVVDEVKHAAYFKQRVEELGGSIALTPDETRLGFLDRFNSHGLGISDKRFDEEKFLDMREIITFFCPPLSRGGVRLEILSRAPAGLRPGRQNEDNAGRDHRRREAPCLIHR